MTVHSPPHPRPPIGHLHGVRRLELLWRVAWRSFTRRILRDQEAALIGLGMLVGIGSGLGVVLLRGGVSLFHMIAFDIPLRGHLSDGYNLDWWRVLLVPTLGGLVVGGVAYGIRRWRDHDIIDAIEANALFGGRMSVLDSVNLALTTLLSGGFGASVGLEAAYTQVGGSLGSKTGLLLRLRRDDIRTLVGCGAGAAIAAAFNAPFAGAFYAFELVIGSYTLGTLAPVVVATLAGTFTARALFGADPSFIVDRPVSITGADYGLFVLLGVVTAILAITVMRGVSATEQWFQARSTPRWLRPMIGGLVLGTMALTYPQILGSGHGGIVLSLHMAYSLAYASGLIAARILGSAISIGAGFRGGMFSSSLFLGSLVGNVAAMLLQLALPTYRFDALAFTLVGMGAMAAGIIGAPITMILLVLEGTGDFSATVGVMCGVITTSVAVRRWFGYSFATWRFHLRGLKIMSPEDISWLDDLRIDRLMRTDIKMVPSEMTVAALRRLYPLGSINRVAVMQGDRLAGLLDLAELHGPDLGGAPEIMIVGKLLPASPVFLTKDEDIRSALAKFSEAQTETLPVVDDVEHMRLVGYLTESYALRRYSQELERRRGQDSGENNLYSSVVRPNS